MYQYTLYNIDYLRDREMSYFVLLLCIVCTVLLINGYSDENEHNKWDSKETEFMNVQFR